MDGNTTTAHRLMRGVLIIVAVVLSTAMASCYEPAQIAGTSSFYSQFRRSPVGRRVVRVCHGTACHVAGADQITEELRRHLDIPPNEDTDSQRLFTLDKVACVGCCSLAPVMMIEEDTAGRLTPATARQTLDTVARRT